MMTEAAKAKKRERDRRYRERKKAQRSADIAADNVPRDVFMKPVERTGKPADMSQQTVERSKPVFKRPEFVSNEPIIYGDPEGPPIKLSTIAGIAAVVVGAIFGASFFI